jgi:hypothetical protein
LSIPRFREAAAHDVPLEQVLARTMREVFQNALEDPLFRVTLTFLISASDPRVQVALAHRHAAFTVTANQAWQSLMDAYGVRLREPYRVQDLTTAVACQIAGAVSVWFADPQGLADPAGEDGSSLTSRAILAIFRQFTEPA